MDPFERLFLLELEFQRRLRLSARTLESSALHTSYALQAGYEPLMRTMADVTLVAIEKHAQRATLAGDPRDVLAAKDSLIDLFGLRYRQFD